MIPFWLSLGLIFPVGLFLILHVPAMWAADGGAHVARVFQIAEGGNRAVYINHNHGVGYGGEIPLNVNDLKNLELDDVGKSPIAPGAEGWSKILTPQEKQEISQISHQKISKQKVLISFVNTAAYSPVAYAPNVVGVKAGMKLNINLGHTLELARLCGLFAFMLCVGYALFTLRKSALKWAVMTVSLLPLVVFQASVITADSFLLSVTILFSALVIKALFSNLQLNLADKILLYICVLIIPLAKSAYFPIVFVILLLPRRHWANRTRYWLWAASALAISMIGFGMWASMTTDVAASNGLVRGDTFWKYGDADVQKNFVVHHPLLYLRVLFDSVLYGSKYYMDSFFGWLGFTYLPVPGIAQLAGYMSLGLSLLLAGKTKHQKYVPGAVLAIIGATVLLIFTTLYLYYTSIQNTMVEGVQGRYFLPLAVLFIAAFAAYFPKLRVAREGAATAKVLLAVLITFCFLFSSLRYGLAIV